MRAHDAYPQYALCSRAYRQEIRNREIARRTRRYARRPFCVGTYGLVREIDLSRGEIENEMEIYGLQGEYLIDYIF